MEDEKKNTGFFKSELTLDNEFQKTEDFLDWFEGRKKANKFSVEKIPLNKLDKWAFDSETKMLAHESGKFFKIKGLRVVTKEKTWDQPIMDQPEIGILGIITKKFNGVRHFLMQAKMEPGNIGLVQLSPTVQATKSNYSLVHKGNSPKYIEYFLDRKKSTILIDQLQTEFGRRFLRKRNRNIIVDVNEEIPVYEDFKWLTLGEIKNLLEKNNFVNLDSRSVISCINFLDEVLDPELAREVGQGFKKDLFFSMTRSESLYSLNDLLNWLTEMKSQADLSVEEIPLKDLNNWVVNDDEIKHAQGNFFKVIGASVIAGNREVGSWNQPLIEHSSPGLVGFLAKKFNGVLHFLMQAKMEPGSFSIVEIVPTVECDDIEGRLRNNKTPKFLEFFISATKEKIKYDSFQSLEGGRFYHCQNRCIVLETDADFPVPENYRWMTLNQIIPLIKHNYFNIDARGLLTYLKFK